MDFRILLPLILVILTASSAAQLVGCDNVQCPKNPNNSMLADCQLGSVTAENIGIANLTTHLSARPLTWAIGQSENRSISTSVISRDFYLGRPPSLNVQLQSGTPDCAIFFHGIAPSLQFPNTSGIDQGKSSGTCADVLKLPCMEALQNQVAEVLTTNATVDCSSLAAMLQSTAPASCPVQNGNWGEVSGKCEFSSTITQVSLLTKLTAIFGFDAPPPLSLSNCHPSVESDYSLTYIDGVSSSPLRTAGIAYTNFALGITPILTILRNALSSNPEAHLTCLKVITSGGNNANEQMSGSTVVSPDLVLGYSALLVLGILSFL
jgi:hypothetical protein